MSNLAFVDFRSGGNIRMYPRSGFRSGGTSAKITLLENHPFVNPKQISISSTFAREDRLPLTPLEREIALAWAAELGLQLSADEALSPFADFYRLGGGSVQAVQLSIALQAMGPSTDLGTDLAHPRRNFNTENSPAPPGRGRNSC